MGTLSPQPWPHGAAEPVPPHPELPHPEQTRGSSSSNLMLASCWHCASTPSHGVSIQLSQLEGLPCFAAWEEVPRGAAGSQWAARGPLTAATSACAP